MIAAIIQGRLGSKRFPNKILKKINHKETVLDYIVERISKSKKINKIIIATTKNKIDDKIEKHLKKKKILFFRGSENDVLSRYYFCSKKFKVNIIIRITSDCPLVDPKIIDKMIDTFLKKKLDYLTNTVPIKKPMWPDGSDIEIFSYKALEKAFRLCKNKFYREHVTFFFWKQKKNYFKIDQYKNKYNWSNFRYTLDYSEDLKVIRFIVNKLAKEKIFGYTNKIINILKQNPNIRKKNSKYFFGIGWEEK
tara:strand:+ start:34 stop:783 length:750 start_codon:yes stop_codon:yes gene_type:complete